MRASLAGGTHRARCVVRRRETVKATQLLKQQHREVEQLFGKVAKAERPAERKKLAGEIASKLEVHTTIEEEIFYPAYRESSETKKSDELTLEAFEEHHVVKLVLAELPEVDPADESFEAKMTVLKELIEHHVEEEEKEMFPDAEKKLGKGRLEELGAEMEERAGELEA
jgi:hemerythrin superfamily protein